jgi:hypothetical protein
MSLVLSWIAGCLATLLLVAVVVAWWEHLGRLERRQRGNHDGDSVAPARPAVTSVDVDLGATATLTQLEGDAATRRELLEATMSRMSRDGSGMAAQSRGAWIDTAPMIGQGLAVTVTVPEAPRPEPARTP